MSYSTYLGGSGFDVITGIAVDGYGNVYLTGYTNSHDLPRAGSVLSVPAAATCGSGENTYTCFDAFIAKVDPTGQGTIYIAYLGGSGDDYATGIAVDSAGSAYITGYTNSPDFPTINAVQPLPGGGSCGAPTQPTACLDAFAAKLDPFGSEWIFATYLGGGSDDFAEGIAVAASGSIAITGTTTSLDFPMHGALLSEWGGGGSDAFVAMLDPNGTRFLFSTYLGGSGDDYGSSLAIDAQEGIYLAGYTNSADLPSTGGPQSTYSGGTCGALSSTFLCFDAYATKLSADGSLVEYLTYLGGTGGDYANGIAVGAEGSATIAGMTTSQDFPTTYKVFQISGGGNNTDAFVARLNPLGTALIYSTYLGGTGAEAVNAVAVNSDGRAFVAGYTYGSGVSGVNLLGSSGFYDFVLAVLGDDGSALEFSASMGGTAQEKARAVAVDGLGNVFVAGETFSTDFPVSRELQSAYAGGSFDGALTKFALGDLPFLHAAPVQIEFGEQRVASASEPRAVRLTNIGAGELAFESFEAAGNFAVAANNCASLESGSGCEVSLRFLPSTTGPRVGSLTVRHDGFEDTTRIELTGLGIAPETRLSVTSVIYESQLVGTESGPEEITLSNTGTASLELSGIALSGEFKQSNDCTSSIPVDGSCKVNISFIPRTSGDRTGSLAVIEDLPGGSKQVSLSGRGTDFALSASPGEAAVRAGEPATYTLTVIPLSGFRGNLSLACAGAPKAATCLISPALASLDGSNPAEAKVTVSTATRARTFAPPRRPSGPVQPALLCGAVLTVILLSCGLRRPSRHSTPLRNSWDLALVLTFAGLMNACGGGISNLSTPSSGTPPGTYTIRVTGTVGGVTRGAELALLVR